MFFIAPTWKNEIKELTNDPLNNLINVLLVGGKDIRLMILNFVPQLRYVLHANQLDNVNYWSVWDSILNIEQIDGIPLAPEDLDLPDDVEMLYSNRRIGVYRDGDFYAQIAVNQWGFVEKVEIDNEEQKRTDIYDDRGFKIQSKFYQHDELIETVWFNAKGQGIVQVKGAKVKILAQDERFKKTEYAALDELLLEFTDEMLSREFIEQTDAFLTSPGGNLRELNINLQKKIDINYVLGHVGYLSDEEIEKYIPQIKGSQRFFVDNQYTFKQLQRTINEQTKKHLKVGYPYGTTEQLGNSNEEKRLIIYWKLGFTTSNQKRDATIKALIQYMTKNSDVALIVESDDIQKATPIAKAGVEYFKQKYDFIHESDQQPLMQMLLAKERKQPLQEVLLKIQGRVMKEQKRRASTQTLTDEVDWDEFVASLNSIEIKLNSKRQVIFEDLKQARLVLDVGEPYDTLTQLNAISAGIPQINSFESPLVANRRNGWLIQEEQTLTEGLDYFLQELGHWNRSLVDSVQYMEQFALERQANWWEKKLNDKKN